MSFKSRSSGAFGDLSKSFCDYDTSEIVILPIPYDFTSTWQKGSDKGPDAILNASPHLEFYDIETKTEVFRSGIFTMNPVECPHEPDKLVEKVYDVSAELLKDNKFIVGLGGEHTVSVGIVKAYTEKYDDLTVLQLDAHSDLRDSYLGNKYNHACVMARIGEFCPFVQVGIRSMDRSELDRMDQSRVIFAHDLIVNPGIISGIDPLLSEHVYLTIDLDVFDPAIMPSTGTPEPGGLDWYTVLGIIQSVAANKNIVGFDVTELLPDPKNKAPDFLAAKLIYRILSIVFSEKKHGDKPNLDKPEPKR